jgi:CheY-like chemotaxis protein
MLKRDDAIRLIRSIAHQVGASISEREEAATSSEASDLVIEVRLKAEPKPIPPIRNSHGPRRYKVLHVEDMDRTANLVFYYLRASYDVDNEKTGEGALARALKNEYDYILLDLDLGPGMTAYDFAELVRETEHYATVPIIALAAYHSRKDVEQCMQAGCTAFLSKPFLKEDLLHLMEELEAKVPAVKGIN